MREAILYENLPNGRVRCLVCPWRCNLAPGKRGVCRVRLNDGGKLYTLIYDLCSSVAVDPVEKKPVFHFQPGSLCLSLGTLGCNMRCRHCQNRQISHEEPIGDSDPRLSRLSPEEAVSLALAEGCQGIAWTYNEPTIWLEYTLDSARLCRERGLYAIYVTNGYITEEALDEIAPYLDVYRVDVKGFTNELYKELAGIRDFSPVLRAAERAKRHWGLHVEVVTNVIPTMNDDESRLRGIARWIRESLGPETPWHVTRFYPHFELRHLPPTPLATLERAREIGLDEGLPFVYMGNVPGHKAEHTYCPSCGNLAIERQGYLIARYHVKEGRCSTCGADLHIREGGPTPGVSALGTGTENPGLPGRGARTAT